MLEAALELFAEVGFKNASIASIARRAGSSKGLVHHYFPTKRDLIAAVLATRIEHMTALAKQQPSGLGAADKLRWWARAIAADADANPSRFRLYLRALTDDDLREIAGGFVPPASKDWRSLFAGRAEPALEARFFQVSLLGILTQRALSPHPTPAGPLVERLLQAVLDSEGA